VRFAGVFAVLVSSGSLFLPGYSSVAVDIGPAFQYFNLVERIDGVGLRNMVNS
jgi:hypothetical protein